MKRWKYALFRHWYANGTSSRYLAACYWLFAGAVLITLMRPAAFKYTLGAFAAVLAAGWFASVKAGLAHIDKVGAFEAERAAQVEASAWGSTLKSTGEASPLWDSSTQHAAAYVDPTGTNSLDDPLRQARERDDAYDRMQQQMNEPTWREL